MTAPWRFWPSNQTVRDDEALDAVCLACAQGWRVHENLAGYRFKCGACGAWVDVPKPDALTPLQIEMARTLQLSDQNSEEASLDRALQPIETMPRDEDGLVQFELPEGRVYEGDVPSNLAMGAGTLRHVRGDVRQKWTNRAILELTAMMLAILIPVLLTSMFLSGDQAETLTPLTSLFGGLLVVAIGFSAPQYTFGGLRRAHVGYFIEAVFVAAAFVVVALGWVTILEDVYPSVGEASDGLSRLQDMFGKGGLIFVYAFAPAVFEELAFRGLFQGKMCALSGRVLGILITAMIFAAAHGIGPGTPLQLSAGLYLGFLRDRSGSLLPGMLVHGLYNGSLVLNHVM